MGKVKKKKGAERWWRGVCRLSGESALELLEARLTHPDRLLGGRRQGVLGRALGAEDVAAVPAVVLGGDRVGGWRDRKPLVSAFGERRLLPCAR